MKRPERGARMNGWRLDETGEAAPPGRSAMLGERRVEILHPTEAKSSKTKRSA
jgi:hypothetical protein